MIESRYKNKQGSILNQFNNNENDYDELVNLYIQALDNTNFLSDPSKNINIQETYWFFFEKLSSKQVLPFKKYFDTYVDPLEYKNHLESELSDYEQLGYKHRWKNIFNFMKKIAPEDVVTIYQDTMVLNSFVLLDFSLINGIRFQNKEEMYTLVGEHVRYYLTLQLEQDNKNKNQQYLQYIEEQNIIDDLKAGEIR